MPPMQQLFKIIAFILVAFANLFEIAAVAALADPGAGCFGKACQQHFFAAFLIAVAFSLFPVQIVEPGENGNRESKRSFSNPMAFPSFFIALFIPMFGTLTASILGFIIKPVAEKDSPIFNEYIDYVKNIDDDMPRFEKKSEESIILKLLEIEPVVDLINSKSKTAVWGSIENLSHKADNSSVAMIREAVRQSDVEIKFLAGIGLEKMEDDFKSQIMAAEKELQMSKNLPAALQYLKISISYLKCGLTPLQLNEKFIADLFSVCSDFNDRDDDATLRFYRAQLLNLVGENDKSLSIIETLIADEALKPEMLLPVAEIMFRAGRIDIVKALIPNIEKSEFSQLGFENGETELDLEELLEFWGSGEKET